MESSYQMLGLQSLVCSLRCVIISCVLCLVRTDCIRSEIMLCKVLGHVASALPWHQFLNLCDFGALKLQKHKVQAEEQRKREKKREKKEKKKDKKEKKDKRSQKQGNSDGVYGNFGEKFSTDGKEGKDDSVQLERSSLTEEHAEPVCLRGPSSSSDSTENSNKRKRLPSPVDVSRGHGKSYI